MTNNIILYENPYKREGPLSGVTKGRTVGTAQCHTIYANVTDFQEDDDVLYTYNLFVD